MSTSPKSATQGQRLRRIAVNLALLAVSTFVSVFALDAMVGVVFELDTSYCRAPNADYDFDSDPFTFHVKLNSDGFRERRLPRRAVRSGKRVLFVGDSMVFGWGVEAEQTFVRLAEQALREQDGADAWEFVNLGVEGTDPLGYRDCLFSYGSQIQPDVVVACIYLGNDALSSLSPRKDLRPRGLLDNLFDLKPSNLLRFVEVRVLNRVPTPPHAMPGTKTANPLTQYVESDDPVVRERLEAIEPEMLDRALRWRVNPYLVAGGIREPDLLARMIGQNNALVRHPSMRLILEEMHGTAQDIGAEFRLVLLAPGYALTREMWPSLEKMGYRTCDEMLAYRRQQRTLGRLAGDLGVPLLDTTPFLVAAGDGVCFAEDAHFTPYGNQVVADLVTRWLGGELEQPPADERPLPPFRPVREWTFTDGTDTKGWRGFGKDTAIAVSGGALRIESDSGSCAILNTSDVIDGTGLDRLRVRMRADRGTHARFYWGRPPEDESGEYPFSEERVAIFPIEPGEEFALHDIRLETASTRWKGTWRALRLDAASVHALDGNMAGAVVEVESIALGHSVHPPAPASEQQRQSAEPQ